jgi:endo-1,4-beta-xylanase
MIHSCLSQGSRPLQGAVVLKRKIGFGSIVIGTLLGNGLFGVANAGALREIVWNNPVRPAISGTTHGSLQSKTMGIEIGHNVFLPSGYDNGDRRYPVVYFLHGAGGNENSDAGGFSGLLSRAIEERKLPPVICVFPNGGMSGYADHPDAKIMVETHITKELIPYIDSKYRTIRSRRARVLCGFSMGGGGAVRLALNYPDKFGAAAAWAAALGFRSGGIELLNKQVTENASKIAGKTRLLLIVGDQDITFSGHAPFVENLKRLQISHEYRILEGVGHNLGIYYQKTSADIVRFIADSLASEK